MNYGAVVAAALGSTAFFAVATALKHRSARHGPRVRHFGPAELRSFIAAAVRHPLWIAGSVADLVGLGLQILALHLGALSVVQPLLVSAVLFSLLVSHWVTGTRVSRRETALGALLVAAVAGFLLVSGAVTAGSHQDIADRLPAVVAGILAVAVAAGCVLTARKVGSGPAAALLGVAVGTLYAVTAALIKACTNLVDGGILALLSHWQPYAVVIVGATGLLLAQLAFQAGPLRASLPATATTDPLLSVVLGVVVYDERLRSTTASVVLQVLCLLTMSGAVVTLSRIRVDTEANTASGPVG